MTCVLAFDPLSPQAQAGDLQASAQGSRCVHTTNPVWSQAEAVWCIVLAALGIGFTVRRPMWPDYRCHLILAPMRVCLPVTNFATSFRLAYLLQDRDAAEEDALSVLMTLRDQGM